MNEAENTKNKIYYGYIIVAASFIIMVIILGLYSIFGIFFKPIVTDFDWSRGVTSGAYAFSQILNGMCSVFMGWLNDRLGPRVVLSICGVFTGIGYMLMSQIQDVWHLYAIYGILIGVGSAIFAPVLSTVARWFKKRRSTMTGVVVAGIGTGVLIIPLIANSLILAYNWRTTCLIIGAATFILVILAAQFLKLSPAKIGQFIDGEKQSIESENIPSQASINFKKALHSWQFWVVFFILFCSGFTGFAIQIHIVPYATDIGVTATAAAGILAAMGGANIIGQIGVGSIGDRIGNRIGFIIGFVLMSFSIFLLFTNIGLWPLYLFAVIFGIGFGNNTTHESPLVAWLFGLASHGIIFGTLVLGFNAGSAIGPLVTGYLFDAMGNYSVAFIIAICVGLIGLLLSSILKPLPAYK